MRYRRGRFKYRRRRSSFRGRRRGRGSMRLRIGHRM